MNGWMDLFLSDPKEWLGHGWDNGLYYPYIDGERCIAGHNNLVLFSSASR